MSLRAELEQLESRIGYSFADRELLLRALTHKSIHAEASAPEAEPCQDNEQLEFLGDSILGFVASEFLFRHCPQSPEGALSRLKALRVSSLHLHSVAVTLGLGKFLRLGRGEEQNGGRTKKALLADAMEAIIAAIYLDGGFNASRRFVEELVLRADAPGELSGEVPLDAKSAIQEYAQSRKLPVPRYQIVEQVGPEHAKIFTVEVRVGPDHTARAIGASKKIAGQAAAALLLEKLRHSEAVAQELSASAEEHAAPAS
jgi:ribonuclease-3